MMALKITLFKVGESFFGCKHLNIKTKKVSTNQHAEAKMFTQHTDVRSDGQYVIAFFRCYSTELKSKRKRCFLSQLAPLFYFTLALIAGSSTANICQSVCAHIGFQFGIRAT